MDGRQWDMSGRGRLSGAVVVSTTSLVLVNAATIPLVVMGNGLRCSLGSGVVITSLVGTSWRSFVSLLLRGWS